MNNTLYSKNPLDPASKQIRLIQIKNGNRKMNKLCCEFRTFSVMDTDDLPYMCLSYTWGKTPPEYPIYIDSCQVSVTKSVFDFLWQALNTPEWPEYIWIDALCINQKNQSEQNHQVGMMSDIYFSVCNHPADN
jgi:hypothetical protein